MPLPNRQEIYLKRRLNRWQIFFIAIGGIIGIGFFNGASKSMAIAGPVGALVAVVVVGLVVITVMECICELIVLFPVPNAMVEMVKTFVDEDLGAAVGIMYWYTYCVTFSALIITVADLMSYWHARDVFKSMVYVLVPIFLMILNAFPVELFGWVEFFGGIVKLVLVVGVFILMFCINGGAGPDHDTIGTRYFQDGFKYNQQVASSKYQGVFEAIPLATYAYVGVELLTLTAFEARDPGELRLPAASVGWFSMLLYSFATGSFVANLSWTDQNLPRYFNQALTMITDPSNPSITKFISPQQPTTSAAPLITLYRCGLRFLPGFLNACFIYSAVSCANTALYVASRQLYGMTRTLSVDYNSGMVRRALAWMSSVHYRTRAPWPAIAISALVLCWLPFIRVRTDDEFIQNVQNALINVGSVSCILMWASQCVAFIMFYHWRQIHTAELDILSPRWDKLLDKRNGGHLKDFQPFLAYVGATSTLFIVFFFNIVSLWNGKTLTVKAVSAFVSPAIVLLIWLAKKFSRRDGRRFHFFRTGLADFAQFERRLQALDDMIFPGEGPLSGELQAKAWCIRTGTNREGSSGGDELGTIITPDVDFTNPYGENGSRPRFPTYNRSNLVLSMPTPSKHSAVATTEDVPTGGDKGKRKEIHEASTVITEQELPDPNPPWRSHLAPSHHERERSYGKSGRELEEIYEVDSG